MKAKRMCLISFLAFLSYALWAETTLVKDKAYALKTDLIGFRPLYTPNSNPVFAAGAGSEFVILAIDGESNTTKVQFTNIFPVNQVVRNQIGKKIEEINAVLGGELVGPNDLGVFQISTDLLSGSLLRPTKPYKFTAGLLVIPAKLVLAPDVRVEGGGVLGTYIGEKVNFDSNSYGAIVFSTGPSFSNDYSKPIDWFFAVGTIFQVNQIQLGVLAGWDVVSDAKYISLSTGFAFLK
ncbi:MAG: hypothetical protein Q8M76_07330 [Spirochaetaceae bacterium]|nr:hypothetical protein [Spirochaetaceae bacterium]